MVRKSVKQEVTEIDSVNKNVISEFVNIALACAKLKKIEVEQENGIHNLRTNLNLFIYGQIGSTKSTLLKQIAKQTNSKMPFTDLTYPALVGSVDKLTRQLILGASWECRNKLLILDEFDFSKKNKDDIRTLLQLIEGGEYNKKLASFSAPCREIDEDLSYNFENGEFNIKTRFSLILATMKYPYRSQNLELQALSSRSVCLPWYPELEEIKKLAQGYSLFQYVDKMPKKTEIRIKKKDWDFIISLVEKTENPKNLLRMAGDCARVFVVEGKHRLDLYDIIIKQGSRKFG